MTSGPLFALPQPLHLFLRWQNNSTAQSHCHQHNITVAEVSPEADSVYTSTTTDLLYLEKKRTSASPSSRLDSKKKNKQTQRRGDATRHVTMRDIFSSHSGAWRQCLEAVTLSIGQHKRVFVMAICWHPVWRRKNSEDWRKRCFWWALLSRRFPSETSYCTLRRRSSFHRDEGFLNPLNAYHGHAAAVWNGHLRNGSSGDELINKTRRRKKKKKKGRTCEQQAGVKRNVPTALLSIELFNVLHRRRCQACFRAPRKSVPMWQLCHCVLLLLFQMSDKCQPLHRLAFC